VRARSEFGSGPAARAYLMFIAPAGFTLTGTETGIDIRVVRPARRDTDAAE